MGQLDSTFGTLCIGYVLAWGLFGVMSMQAFNYFRRFKNDKLWIKLLVCSLWILDTLQLITIGHALYYWLITNNNNPSALLDTTWSFNVGVTLNNTALSIVQLFLARRVYVVSGGNRCLSGIIVMLSISYYALEFVTFIRTFQLVKLANFYQFEWIASTGLGCAAVADLTIAASLCFYLNRNRTGITRTDSIIDKLLLYAMNTGLLTSLFVLADMITLVTMQKNLIHFGFNVISGKMYTNSLLATLNFRDTIRKSERFEGGNTTIARSAFDTGTVRSGVVFTGIETTILNSEEAIRPMKESKESSGENNIGQIV